jgi:hypothetical protein
MESGSLPQERDVMPKAVLALLAVLALATPGPTGGDDDDGGKRPELLLRATPRFSFSPANILFTAELKGGDDVEELYCPEVEWEWGDGGKSVSEGDCDPWEPGAKIARRHMGRHEFRYPGAYRVRVILRKADKTIMQRTIRISVKPGLGDRNRPY